jgi:N-acetylmuramoyl-L-alanine amidase
MSTGEMIVDLARKHIGEKYVLSAEVPKDASDYSGPWDCSEFASWLVYQVSGQLYGCVNDNVKPAIANAFTGAWETDAKSKGKIITILQAAGTPGSFLLRRPGEAGITIGHVVVSDGKGGTIEAHSHVDGVIQGKLDGRTWTMGIYIPWIDYSEGEAPQPPSAAPESLLRFVPEEPMTGSAVRQVQQQLRAAGFSPGKIDGSYGNRTMTAVSAFQKSKGLVPDGEVGPVTMKPLRRVKRT